MKSEMENGVLESLLLKKASISRTIRVEAEGRILEAGLKDGIYTLLLGDANVTTDGRRFNEKRLMVSVEEGKVTAADGTDNGSTDSANNPIKAGMYLRLTGKAELIQAARNPGEFDYRLYYRSQKLRCRIKATRAEYSAKGMTVFHSQLSAVREFIREALSYLYQEQDRGIYQAILLGDKSEMDSDIRELYQDGGIAHILAVSGLHVSLIGMGFYGFLRKRGAGYGTAGLAAAGLLFFYGSMTGFGSSVFRAIFMVFCSFLASYLGRTYDLLSAMSLSLLALAFDSPYLIFTSGLQLSYGAVGTVGLANEWRAVRIRRGEEKKSGDGSNDGDEVDIRSNFISALQVSASIQIVTLPIILYHFFEFPLYGILLNLLVIPMMAYAAGSGIAAVGLYGIWKTLTPAAAAPLLSGGVKWLGIICHGVAGPGHYILSFYRELCRISLELPFSTVVTGRPPIWTIALYYGVLAFFCHRKFREGEEYLCGQKRASEHWGARGALLAVSVLFLSVRPKVRGMEVFFLDVGQGDGIFLRTGETAILTDCGSSQYRSVGKNRLAPFLKSKGVRRLDYIFISHADSDHINGIVWMLENEERISVGQIIMPAPGEGDEAYQKIGELGSERGAVIEYMEAGQKLKEGGLVIEAVYPNRDLNAGDRNGHSLVLSVAYQDFRMLLTGDVEDAGERRMLEWTREAKYGNPKEGDDAAGRPPLPENVTVLKAAHHGSATSTGREFLACVKPAFTILSYGRGNSYGHPSPETVERLTEIGTEIWRTEVSGAIKISTDGKKMKVSGFVLDRIHGLGL